MQTWNMCTYSMEEFKYLHSVCREIRHALAHSLQQVNQRAYLSMPDFMTEKKIGPLKKFLMGPIPNADADRLPIFFFALAVGQ